MAEAEQGTQIAGHYRVVRTLGRGSFGITYAAEDLRGGGMVAIKQLDLGRVEEWKTVELFEREARILANLDHPQIPDYVEFVPIQPDAPGYLVQELAPGRSLQARLDGGERFSEARVRDLAEQLLGVLDYLGGLLPPVIHRDIKPGNVIIDDEGRCYLVDFGSVRDAVEASGTGGSTVAGTFGYMAPEQLHGDASARSDLFGLGTTLIHLLTGISPAELPRVRLKVDFRPQVPVSEELARFIDRLIEPMPEDRFASADEALDVLRGIVRTPAPEGGDLSGGALAQLVAHEHERAEAEARRAQALARRRAEAVARRSGARVTLSEDDEGFTLAIRPPPLSRRMLIQLPIAAFLLINPGFAVVGGFPFLGPYWPMLSENVLGRIVVWVLFLVVLNVAIAAARGRWLHLRVAGEHFAAWHRDPSVRIALGEVGQLRISTEGPGANGLGSAVLAMGDVSKAIGRLSAKDLEVLERASSRFATARERG